MRTAWFSPLPPVRTGVSAVSADAVAALAARGHLVDTYQESNAHDFPWMHRRRPYDLIVYQVGNSSHHDYEWPYALRYPGLVVLHDTHLHHARAALLLREKRRDDYRHELAWSEPGVDPDAAELAVAGFDSRLYYEWPMVRALVACSLGVAVHGEATRRELLERLSTPDSPSSDSHTTFVEKIVSIRLGHGQLVSAAEEAGARNRIRARHGIAEDAIVFGVFGGLTPEKRLPQIVDAFRAVVPYAPDARLLLGGAPAAHFPLDAFAADPRIAITGYIDEAELTDYIAAVDVSLNLRWPTARETSGPWLRALAAGKATIITDLLHLSGVASLDPRTWAVNAPSDIRDPITESRWTMSGNLAASAADTSDIDDRISDIGHRISDIGHRISDLGPSEAIAIAIDIVDEDHSLRLAMRRLATDPALRERLGRAAREYWQREHTIAAMTDDYERILHGLRGVREVLGVEEMLPAHLRPDGDEHLRDLLDPFGTDTLSRASIAREPRERSAPAQRRARARVGESEGRSPSDLG